jgi:hypothetical protein
MNIQVRFQCQGHPTLRDGDTVSTYTPDTPIHVMFTARPSAPGSTITQVEGDYVRTWTLLEVLS